MKRSANCVLGGAWALVMLAAAPLAAQETVPTQVRVDMVIFRHTTASAEQINNLLNLPPQPGDHIQASVDLFRDAPQSETAAADNVRLLTGYRKLNDHITQLEAAESFELLHQVAWRQPVYDPQNAVRVSLLPQRRGELLKGTAQLSFERFFQFAVTLLYEPGFSNLEPTEQAAPESDTIFIHLKEVMTDNVLYYLDHPLVGILAQVTILESANPGDSPSAEP